MITWSYFWAIENYQLNNRIFFFFSQAVRSNRLKIFQSISFEKKSRNKSQGKARERFWQGSKTIPSPLGWKEGTKDLSFAYLCSRLTSECRYQTFFRVSLGQNRNLNQWISVCQQKFGFMYGVLLILIPVKKNLPLFPKDGWTKFEIQQDYLEKWFWDLKIEVPKT